MNHSFFNASLEDLYLGFNPQLHSNNLFQPLLCCFSRGSIPIISTPLFSKSFSNAPLPEPIDTAFSFPISFR